MGWPRKLLKYTLLLGLAGTLVAAGVAAGVYFHFRSQVPPVDNLRQVRLQVPLRVYSADHRLIAQFGEKQRYPVHYDAIPKRMIEAFVAAEDQHFFTHHGIDPWGLARAAVTLITTGRKKQGGSTITMQVARNFYLSRKRTFTRKIREIILALHIEEKLTKEEILELYLNKIYLGHRAYGVRAAAEVYYGKPLDQLTLAETAMIAGLPKAPSRYNPIADPARARQRRNYVLGRMRELGFITDQEARQAMAAPITARLHRARIEVDAPWVAEMVRKDLVARFGEDAYTGGYQVYTSILSKNQAAANQALRDALEAYDRRHGWRGPEGHLDKLPPTLDEQRTLVKQRGRVGGLEPALVTAVNKRSAKVVTPAGEIELPWQGLAWARPYIDVDHQGPAPKRAGEILKVGDLVRVRQRTDKKGKPYWALAQVPEVSGALVSLNPKDGAILALVGGYDFHASKFNRATQARRQPGSGFKAVVYSAALEAGFTPASVINDAPVVVEDKEEGDTWRPENYSGRFFGPTRLRLALTKSRNLVSIRLVRSMGIRHLLEHAKRFGFDPKALPHALSLALGSGEVTPLQMARAYAVLANGGYLIDPWLIERIEQNDQVVYQAHPKQVDCPPESTRCDPAPRTLNAENRYMMYSMMQDVITRGTGWRARVLKRRDLAGKTGTTNEQRDAWFNGYNQHLVTVVWTGFDDNRPLGKGEVGGKVALPAWIDYMKVALQDIPDEPPRMPPGLVTARIDTKTGLRVRHGGKGTMFEIFRPGTEPPFAEEEQAQAPAEDELFEPDGEESATPAQKTEPEAEELF